jgi:hypothetical protein
MGQRRWRIPKVVQALEAALELGQCDSCFKDNHLEETHLTKIAITDIRQTLHHAVEIPWQVGTLEFSKNSSK